MSPQPPEPGTVDLRLLKAEAARLLPTRHPLRLEIQEVPDKLDAQRAAPALESLLHVIQSYKDLAIGSHAALDTLDTLELVEAPFYDEATFRPGRPAEPGARRPSDGKVTAKE